MDSRKQALAMLRNIDYFGLNNYGEIWIRSRFLILAEQQTWDEL